MAWTKVKTAIVVGTAVILTAGTTAPIIIHHFRANDSTFSWTKELTDSDNAKFVALTGTTPAQAARTFLEASSSGDWAEVAKYWDPKFLKKHPEDLETHKNFYGGMELISLGKPFKGRFRGDRGAYYGVLVPYEIRLKDGSVKKYLYSIKQDIYSALLSGVIGAIGKFYAENLSDEEAEAAMIMSSPVIIEKMKLLAPQAISMVVNFFEKNDSKDFQNFVKLRREIFLGILKQKNQN